MKQKIITLSLMVLLVGLSMTFMVYGVDKYIKKVNLNTGAIIWDKKEVSTANGIPFYLDWFNGVNGGDIWGVYRGIDYSNIVGLGVSYSINKKVAKEIEVNGTQYRLINMFEITISPNMVDTEISSINGKFDFMGWYYMFNTSFIVYNLGINDSGYCGSWAFMSGHNKSDSNGMFYIFKSIDFGNGKFEELFEPKIMKVWEKEKSTNGFYIKIHAIPYVNTTTLSFYSPHVAPIKINSIWVYVTMFDNTIYFKVVSLLSVIYSAGIVFLIYFVLLKKGIFDK